MFGTKYLVEHEVHFACEPGFELQGSSTRICQADGSWSGEEPRCTGTTSLPWAGCGYSCGSISWAPDLAASTDATWVIGTRGILAVQVW